MREIVHQLPDSDQILGQTHIRVQKIQHNPDGGIIMHCELGVVTGGNFQPNNNIRNPRVNIPGDDAPSVDSDTSPRAKFDQFAIDAGSAPDVAQDPLTRYEDALLAFLDSESWATYWSL